MRYIYTVDRQGNERTRPAAPQARKQFEQIREYIMNELDCPLYEVRLIGENGEIVAEYSDK